MKVKWTIIIIVVAIFAVVIGFIAVGRSNDEAPYYLLYKEDGTKLNAYQQSKVGAKKYQYKLSMESMGDLIGSDRTADLHTIDKPDDAVADVEMDMENLTASKSVLDQFLDLENSLLGTIKSDFNGSPKVKTVMLAEVEKRIKTIKNGDLSYRVPLNSYLKLSKVELADGGKSAKTVISSARIDVFVYKKKSTVSAPSGKADFSEKNMTSALMWKKDLRKVPMYGTWFCQAIFAESNVAGGDMSKTNLTGVLFIDNDLIKCDLSGANMSGTVLIGDDLTGANLKGVNFSGTIFKSLGTQKVKIDSKWKSDISSSKVKGIKNVEWVN